MIIVQAVCCEIRASVITRVKTEDADHLQTLGRVHSGIHFKNTITHNYTQRYKKGLGIQLPTVKIKMGRNAHKDVIKK